MNLPEPPNLSASRDMSCGRHVSVQENEGDSPTEADSEQLSETTRDRVHEGL